MTHIDMLYRYPVKGLSPERVSFAGLKVGKGLTGDREYALALPSTKFDPASPEPLRKTSFAVLVAHEKLARLQTTFDRLTKTLVVRERGQHLASGCLDTVDGRRAIEDYFETFMGADVGGRLRVVSAPGHRFTDVSVTSRDYMMAVSVVNLATVRDLGNRIGVPLDPLRFRANIYIDGLPAGAELDWVDKEVMLGPVKCLGAKRTRRCAATGVDPATGVRDLNIPEALHTHFGHMDLGVYLFIRGDGVIEPGSTVIAP